MSKAIDSYTFPFRDNDFDYKNQMHPTQVLDFFQTIAGRHATKLGIGYDTFKNLNLCWILVKTKYKVYNNPNREDFLKLVSWPLAPNRIEYNRCYRIKDQNDKLLIEGLSKWCIVDYVNHKISRYHAEYPGELVDDNVNIEFDKDLIRENVLDENVIKTYEYKFSHKVLRTDLDLNSHMNNTKYANLVYNVINNDKTIDEFEIDYINQSLLDEVIDVYTKNVDGNDIVIGINKDKNICIFKSIVSYK